MRKTSLAAIIAAVSVSAASAQELQPLPRTLLLPGSVNATIGTIAPSERDNVLTSVAVEQGVTLWQHGPLFVVGFLDVTVRHDSQGLNWNRRVPMMSGAKLVWVANGGVLQAGVGASTELKGNQTVGLQSAPFVNYWAGWRGDALGSSAGLLPRAYPGQLYASTGVMTAAEPGNWTSSVSAQQGVAVLRHRSFSVIPFVGASMNMDTARYTWNNRTQLDAGVKVSRSVLGGVVDVGVSNRRDHLRLTGETRTAPAVFVNFWLGWTPRVARH